MGLHVGKSRFEKGVVDFGFDKYNNTARSEFLYLYICGEMGSVPGGGEVDEGWEGVYTWIKLGAVRGCAMSNFTGSVAINSLFGEEVVVDVWTGAGGAGFGSTTEGSSPGVSEPASCSEDVEAPLSILLDRY